jgi:hypothetical protein
MHLPPFLPLESCRSCWTLPPGRSLMMHPCIDNPSSQQFSAQMALHEARTSSMWHSMYLPSRFITRT